MLPLGFKPRTFCLCFLYVILVRCVVSCRDGSDCLSLWFSQVLLDQTVTVGLICDTEHSSNGLDGMRPRGQGWLAESETSGSETLLSAVVAVQPLAVVSVVTHQKHNTHHGHTYTLILGQSDGRVIPT